jgi:hypothetical protein
MEASLVQHDSLCDCAVFIAVLVLSCVGVCLGPRAPRWISSVQVSFVHLSFRRVEIDSIVSAADDELGSRKSKTTPMPLRERGRGCDSSALLATLIPTWLYILLALLVVTTASVSHLAVSHLLVFFVRRGTALSRCNSQHKHAVSIRCEPCIGVLPCDVHKDSARE